MNTFVRVFDTAAMALLLGAATSMYAQAKLVPENEALRTPEQGLAEHHIALDTASVLAALRNRDPEVRWLAAEKLGFEKNLEAIPSIESALSAETNIRAKINVGAVLASLNDGKGIEALARVCEDENVAVHLRLDAARHLFDFAVPGCSNAIGDALNGGPDSDPALRLQALSFVSHLPKRAGLDTSIARIIESNELRDPNPIVRAAASTSLAEIGDTVSLARLREALPQETDEGARTAMQQSIRELVQKLLSDVRVVN